MFGNQQIGILLLVTHFLASLAVGILFRKYKYKDSPITRDIISHPKEKINKAK